MWLVLNIGNIFINLPGCSFSFIFSLIWSLLISVLDMLLVGTNLFFNLAIKICASPCRYPTVVDLVRLPAVFFLIIPFCGHAIPNFFAIIAFYSALLWSLLLSITPSSSYLVGKPVLLLNALANCFTLANYRNILSQLMYLSLYLCWTVPLQDSW